MAFTNINCICVIGAGVMGQQIALQAAISGYKVFLNDIDADKLQQAQQFTENWLAGRIKKGKLDETQVAQIKECLKFTTDIKEAAGNADLVIEAIVEILEIKRNLLKELDAICPSHTIFATNSSYIVSSKMADATSRPDKVLNMHFFNPVLVMKLVEVVKGPHVSEETVESVIKVAEKMGKVASRVNKEIYGFIANRVFSAITKEACYLYDQGIASLEDIDNAVKNGLGHPQGPFQLLDLTGIDLEYDVLMGKYRSTGDLADKPSPAIVERYVLGEYGRKTKKGFYTY